MSSSNINPSPNQSILNKIKADIGSVDERIEAIDKQFEELSKMREFLIAERNHLQYMLHYIPTAFGAIPIASVEQLAPTTHVITPIDFPMNGSIAERSRYALWLSKEDGEPKKTKEEIYQIIRRYDPNAKLRSFASQFSRAVGKGIEKERREDGTFVYYLAEGDAEGN